MPKKVSFFKTLFESQMYQTHRRNIPEKINRTIALLLSVFFISIYFWNFISILVESFPIFYILNIYTEFILVFKIDFDFDSITFIFYDFFLHTLGIDSRMCSWKFFELSK
ncbi:hypothetical protein LEP1GSC186_3045 [Leptospira noguchii serovar Autumnalis str. ZUN142]|uniref:Uncharacterized protein n=1 Tax=Leptospira noguchii serovar Autumnalis str. ZUN142 TaxID=1085540 RepID=M6UV42_9LEPT|nr:hypothetical protein LEP1GSC186_3045 [Leptospira noguchii serovar Autumnalis str. ZUN142]